MPYIFSPPPSPSSTSPMSNTMLLTKRLSSFLNSNTTPQLHTLLLITPTGKIVSSASPSPASTLRTQSTIACSIWPLYHPYDSKTKATVSSALPNGSSAAQDTQEISSITMQLEFGIMVIRPLKCGLLFVSIGPSISSSSHPSQLQFHTPRSHASPPSSPPPHGEAHDALNQQLGRGEAQIAGLGGSSTTVGSTAPSDAGSAGTNASVGMNTTSILAVRRQADELGKVLDRNLSGLLLGSAEIR